MAYIEENMKLRRGTQDEEKADDGPADPYAELFRLSKTAPKNDEEGNVTNSLAMLTAIPEVDLGMECVAYLPHSSVSAHRLPQHTPQEHRGDREGQAPDVRASQRSSEAKGRRGSSRGCPLYVLAPHYKL